MKRDQQLENNEQARRTAQEVYDLARRITAEIQAEHRCPCVRFTLEPGEPGVFESKAGGTPYLPHDMSWPLDGKGNGLSLLAQVDCAALQELPDFPHAGLLQFWIAWEDAYGVSFDDLTDTAGFRVLYHETMDPSVTAEEVQSKRPPRPEDDPFDDDWLPVLVPCRICLQPAVEQGMNDLDPRFDALFLERWNKARPDLRLEHRWKLHSLVADRLRDYGVTGQPGWKAPYHQLGGYPYFTQYDPRPGRYEDLDVVLFQLDSEMRDTGKGGDLVLWGDCGVCNFFINREALKKRDFSRVAYTWDCC